MKQLSGLDASFLYMETPTTFGHVSGLAIYERPSPDFDPYEHAYRRFEGMIGRLDPMRRRLVTVPLQLDHPYWIDDPEFDLDYHVRHLGLAPPGGDDQLAEQVSRIVARHMDRSRPLWECYVIEGLADGRWAMLTKTHHATIDGASGVILLNMLTDTDPDADNTLEPVEWQGEPVPSDLEMLQTTAAHLATNPLKGLRVHLRLVRDVASSAGLTSVSGLAHQTRGALTAVANRVAARPADDSINRISLPITSAPATPWNRAITAHRRFAMRIDAAREHQAAQGRDGMHRQRRGHGDLRRCAPRVPPASRRVARQAPAGDGAGVDPHRRGGGSLDEPGHEHLRRTADERGRPAPAGAAVHEAMNAAKQPTRPDPGDRGDRHLPVHVPGRGHLGDAPRDAAAPRQHGVILPVNVVISNVPGPRQPLYFAGARMAHYFPVSTIAEGMGLNITVHSYLDQLDFGLIACRELVPDLWDMVDLHIDEIERLFEATGAEPAEAPAAARMRRSSGKHPAAKQPAAKKKQPRTPPKKSAAKRAPATSN